jgi:hypothetical protein
MRRGQLFFWFTFFALIVQSVFLLDSGEEFMFIPLVLILGLATLYFFNREGDRTDVDFQIEIFFIAFSLRLWMGFILYGYGLAEGLGDEDASGYVGGWVLAQNWYNNGFDGFFSDFYSTLLGKQNNGQMMIWGLIMFVLGGPSRMVVSVTNSYAGALLVIVIYRLAKSLFNIQTAKFAAYLTAFWASLILFSAGTSKEILVIFLTWLLLYITVRSAKGLSRQDVMYSAPLLLVLYSIRFYAFYICGAALFIRAIASNRKNMVRNIAGGFFLVVTLLFLLSYSGALDRDREVYDRQNKIMVGWRKGVANQTGSGVDLFSEEGGEVTVLGIPKLVAYFFFSPFPWEIGDGSLRRQIVILENLALILLLFAGFTGIKLFFRDNFFKLLPILSFCVLYAGLQIYSLSNIGLAWRHRQMIMPLFFLMSAFALLRRGTGHEYTPEITQLNINSGGNYLSKNP